MKKIFIFYFALLLIGFGAITSNCQTLQGNAVSWLDADTIEFRAFSGRYYRTRLSGIDAPELRQTEGKECRDALRTATAGKTLTAVMTGRDRYDRFIARLSSPTIPDLSLWLIQSGCAWEYSAPLSVKTIYQTAEATARNSSIGLWLDDCPTPPWSFRASGYLRGAACQ